MSEKKISVVINVYNEEENIQDCLDSLLNQTYKDFELIIVDDGSTDETMDIVESYYDRFEMQLFSTPHVGIKKARRKGIDKTSGEYIIVIDADEILEPDFIEQIINPFDQSEVGAVGGILKSEGEGWVTQGYGVLNEIFYGLRASGNEADWIQGGCSAYRREALEEVGGLANEKVSADKDISWKLSKSGWRVLINRKAVAYHRDPQNVRSVIKREYDIGKRERSLLSKHKDKMSWKEISRFYPFGFLLLLILTPLFFPLFYLLIASLISTIVLVGFLINKYTQHPMIKNIFSSWVVLTLINLAWSSGYMKAFLKREK